MANRTCGRWAASTSTCASLPSRCCAPLSRSPASRLLPASSVKTRFWWRPMRTRPGCIGSASFTAGMTAFYVFRAWFLAFFGKYRGHAHPHESPLVDDRTADAAGGSFARSADSIQHPAVGSSRCSAPKGRRTMTLAWLSAAVGLVGIAIAYMFYVAAARPGRFVRQLLRRSLHADLQQIFCR